MNISKLLPKRRNNHVRPEDVPQGLDLDFYRSWHSDLSHMSDPQLVQHWSRHGKLEGRPPNFRTILATANIDPQGLPEEFEAKTYLELNPDIAAEISSRYEAQYHFLAHGRAEKRSFRFDHKFYLGLYPELRSLTTRANSIAHWLAHGKSEGRHPSLPDLLAAHGVSADALPADLTLETLHQLNPHEHFENIYQAYSALLQQFAIQKLRIAEDPRVNADFYFKLGLHQEASGNRNKALELYGLSLLFVNTADAHEHLGNLALESGKPYQAAAHYRKALQLDSKSHWTHANLARALKDVGSHLEAVNTICAASKIYPGSTLLASQLDGYIEAYWESQQQELECLAASQDRERLINEYDRVVRTICDVYAQVFTKNSAKPVSTSLNNKRVLIVGLTHTDAPQCFRYRIEQKLEQLEYAGYSTETVAWHNHDGALDLINFYDLIIFYRVPALPSVMKLVEYAKALGKITYYELDDLLFEEYGVPPIETYGGLISLQIYTSVTKDIGSHRAIARRCHYAIASTLPLLQKLAPLVITKVGFLHRNGLDKHSRLEPVRINTKGYVNLFYGSGTLAHNTDFIIEALPAISKILREFENVKLTIAGYLELPNNFLGEFEGRIYQLPFTKDIATYWTYLSNADINLAVLHNDELTACKSELKWFEAAALSIPSVVSTTKNYLDVIQQGIDGFIAGNESEWYTALRNLVIDSDLRNRVAKNAFDRVTKEYSVPHLAQNIHQLISQTIPIHGRADSRTQSVDHTEIQ